MIACPLLVSCNFADTRTELEKEVIESGGTIVMSTANCDKFIWWSSDSVLRVRDIQNNHLWVLFSLNDSIQQDSFYNVVTREKEIIWFADSIAITSDNLAIVLFPPSGAPEFWENVFNPCRLIYLSTLNIVPINYPEQENFSQNTFVYTRTWPLWNESDLYAVMDYNLLTHFDDQYQILFMEDRINCEIDIIRYYDDYYLEVAKTLLYDLDDSLYIRGLKAIDNLYRRLFLFVDEANIEHDFPDYFFTIAVTELNHYVESDTYHSLEIPTIEDFVTNIEKISDRKIRYVFKKAKSEGQTKRKIADSILERNDLTDISIDFEESDDPDSVYLY